MKKQFALFALVVLIMASVSCSPMQPPLERTFMFASEEKLFEWVHSSELEEEISRHIEKEFAQEAIKILRETPILVPYYHNKKILPTYNNERMMPQEVSVTIPVDKNNAEFAYIMKCKTEQGEFVFGYNYFRDEESKNNAKQSADIYEYNCCNREPITGTLYLFAPINGKKTLCRYSEYKPRGLFTKTLYFAGFLMDDLYVISVRAESKENLMNILDGLSFQELSVEKPTE